MLQAKQVASKLPLPEPISAVHPVVVIGEFLTPAALPVNTVIEMAGIPADTVPVDYVFVCEDSDSGGSPTLALDIGLLSGLYGKNDDTRTIGQQFAAGSTIARTGGVVQNTVAAGLLLAPNSADRGVGIKIATAAQTLVVGAKWRLYVTCMPKIAELT